MTMSMRKDEKTVSSNFKIGYEPEALIKILYTNTIWKSICLVLYVATALGPANSIRTSRGHVKVSSVP